MAAQISYYPTCDLILYPQKAKKLEEAKVHHTARWLPKSIFGATPQYFESVRIDKLQALYIVFQAYIIFLVSAIVVVVCFT